MVKENEQIVTDKPKNMGNIPYYIIGALLLIGAYKYFKD